MKLRKRDLFLLVAAPALMLGAIGTVGGIEAIKVDAVAPSAYPLANYSYTLVTDVDQLAVNDLVVFASSASNGSADVMANQATNNRGGVAVTINNGAITDFATGTGNTNSASVFQLTAGNQANTFAFKDLVNVTNNYLYCASTSTKNYLKSHSNIDDAASFTIAISDSSHAATITAKSPSGSGARNHLRYNANNGSPLFACYSDSTANVYLYKVEATSSSYTVNFVTNCGQTVASQEVAVGGKVTEPTGLTKEGYSIRQWTTDKEWRTGWNFDTVVTGDMTLYADWVKDNYKVCTLTFNLNGKTGDAPATQQIPEEHYFSTVTDPTYYQDLLAKYTFVGWYEKDSQGNFFENAFNFNDKYSESKTVYAKWSEGDYLFKTSFGSNKTDANLSFTYDSEVIPGTPGDAVWPNNGESAWTGTEDGVTISYSDGAFENPGCKIYSGATFTVTCPHGITEIVFSSGYDEGAKYGLGNLALKSGEPGSLTKNGNTATWSIASGSATSVTFKANAQVRLNGLTVSHGAGDVTNYSNFRDVKMQFRYDLSGLGADQMKWYKAAKDIAIETGLFVTDDTSFTFETKDNLNVAAGKIGKKYANDEANQESPNYTVGIMIPNNHYNTVLRAASYVLMPDGNYYWNTKKEYSVLTMLQVYSTKQNVSAEAKAACSAFASYISNLNA